MKVELSIADDRELRRHIKDVIKGEVLGIARGEIKSIIAQAVSEKAIPSDAGQIERLVKSAINDQVKRELGSSRYSNPSWIQSEARRQIAEFIKKAAEAGWFT
jgi:hypothetical protein